MTTLYAEFKHAADAVLQDLDQSEEYKRRLLKLLENAMIGNLSDEDVRGVIRLAKVELEED